MGQVMGWVMGWVMGRVMGRVMEYDKWVTRGEESGDKVREVGTWCAAYWVWHTCGGVLSDCNS